MTMQSTAEFGTETPGIEKWTDGTNETTFARVEVGELTEFLPSDSASGFRQAVEYLANETGMPKPSDYSDLDPVIMVGAPKRAELYDGRGGQQKWYDLAQQQPGEYAVSDSGRINKDTAITLRPGEIAYVGYVGGKVGDVALPNHPAREMYRSLLAATEQRRNGFLARLGLRGR